MMPLVTWYSSTHERTARDTDEEAISWHSALGTEEIACSIQMAVTQESGSISKPGIFQDSKLQLLLVPPL